MSEVDQAILDQVQEQANQTQSYSYRYEPVDGDAYFIEAWPQPRSEGDSLPVPTEDREGTLHRDGDGVVYRCEARAIEIGDDGEEASRHENLYEVVEEGFDEATGKVEERHLVPRAELRHQTEDTGRAPQHVRDWVMASRKRSLRFYANTDGDGTDVVPVEFEWAPLEEGHGVGSALKATKRDDIEIS